MPGANRSSSSDRPGRRPASSGGVPGDPLDDRAQPRLVLQHRLDLGPLAGLAVLGLASNARSTSSMPRETTMRPASIAGSSTPRNAGRPLSSSSTTAACPRVRMFSARQRVRGPAATGSSSVHSVVLGSSEEATAGASISLAAGQRRRR